jgi:hypothetical protein
MKTKIELAANILGLRSAYVAVARNLGISAMDHVARSDRLRRVLSSRTDASEKRCCLCGDA